MHGSFWRQVARLVGGAALHRGDTIPELKAGEMPAVRLCKMSVLVFSRTNADRAGPMFCQCPAFPAAPVSTALAFKVATACASLLLPVTRQCRHPCPLLFNGARKAVPAAVGSPREALDLAL